MYRHHYRCEVRYGQLRQFVDLSRQISALESARGWAVSTIWTPVVGTPSEVIVIAEYPSLDAFERERAARRADAEYMKLATDTEELMTPGTFRDELLEEPAQGG
ncbi:MAG TPA: NIPSNAP family protein [Acidimicrobiales bacterium]|nr:NIPSNAP family protein [Acidimicrobiales bacterium]